MDLRRSLPIALQSTANDRYIAQTDRVVADITAGREIHDALRRTGVFPADFVHTVEVAERSGHLVESMGHMSRQYEEQARTAAATLAAMAGFAVSALVASLIIVLIIRLFSSYVGMIMDAANM
jgi:type II secretory pathway component PulF